jgi:hypothetical protein
MVSLSLRCRAVQNLAALILLHVRAVSSYGACKAGFTQKQNGYYCTACSRGTAISVDNHFGDCPWCPKGTYAYNRGSKGCTYCDYGTYNNEWRSTDCESCGAGKWTPSRGATYCSDCADECQSAQEETQACSGGNDRVCACTPGKRVTDSDSGSGCTDCGYGFYKAGTDVRTECTACAVNRTTATTTNQFESDCVCSPGHWATTEGPTPHKQPCAVCTGGTYTTSSGATVCDQTCPPNKPTSPSGTGCGSCPDHASAVSNVCECNAQYEKDMDGDCYIDKCLAGSFIVEDTAGSRECKECPIGKYSADLDTSTECDVCPAGKYQPFTGSDGCREVPAGADVSSATRVDFVCRNGFVRQIDRCVPCRPGTGGPPTEQVTRPQGDEQLAYCRACSPGSFGVGDSSPCALCPLGTYAARSGAAQCTPCPAYQHTEYTGSAGVDACMCGDAKRTRGYTLM